jgi:hypothetical protein
MFVSKKEFDKLMARVEALESGPDNEEIEILCDCGTEMVETTTFGTDRQYTCTKCGLKRRMGIEYR